MAPDTFRSKVDTWLLAVLAAAAIVALVAVGLSAIAGEMPWFAGLATLLVSAALPVWIVASTRYELSDASLRVDCGPFRWRIAIADIRTVTPTRSPLSSPALSLDRLRIEYGAGRAIMISPSDKDAFMRALDARRGVAGGVRAHAARAD